MWDFHNSFLFPEPQLAYLCEEEIAPDLQTSTVSARGNRLWMPQSTGEHHELLIFKVIQGAGVGSCGGSAATRLAKS